MHACLCAAVHACSPLRVSAIAILDRTWLARSAQLQLVHLSSSYPSPMASVSGRSDHEVVDGPLMASDRDAIWEQCGVSASVRQRKGWTGWYLTLSGPVDQFPKVAYVATCTLKHFLKINFVCFCCLSHMFCLWPPLLAAYFFCCFLRRLASQHISFVVFAVASPVCVCCVML